MILLLVVFVLALVRLDAVRTCVGVVEPREALFEGQPELGTQRLNVVDLPQLTRNTKPSVRIPGPVARAFALELLVDMLAVLLDRAAESFLVRRIREVRLAMGLLKRTHTRKANDDGKVLHRRTRVALTQLHLTLAVARGLDLADQFRTARVARLLERNAVLVQVELVEGDRVRALVTIHQSMGLGLGGLRGEPVAVVLLHPGTTRVTPCAQLAALGPRELLVALAAVVTLLGGDDDGRVEFHALRWWCWLRSDRVECHGR